MCGICVGWLIDPARMFHQTFRWFFRNASGWASHLLVDCLDTSRLVFRLKAWENSAHGKPFRRRPGSDELQFLAV